tara:strand:- start:168 stop:404 length:237 start_codon:yes stop_codon:yes gene_type:complete
LLFSKEKRRLPYPIKNTNYENGWHIDSLRTTQGTNKNKQREIKRERENNISLLCVTLLYSKEKRKRPFGANWRPLQIA